MNRFAPRTITDTDVTLSKMPRLRHAFEGRDFDPSESEVLNFILAATAATDLRAATRIMERSAAIGAIRYSPNLRAWQGTGFVFVGIEERKAWLESREERP